MKEYPDIDRCKKIEKWMPRPLHFSPTGTCQHPYSIPEMLGVLPFRYFDKNNNMFFLMIAKEDSRWAVYYYGGGHCIPLIDEKELADGLADMIIWLGENNGGTK